MDKIHYLGSTCNSNLQIIKFSFVLVGWPKRVGYTNFKNSYLFNRKELEDAPHINGNGLTRTISLWWVYLQILGLIPLNSSICTGHQDSTHKDAKDHVTLCKSSKVKGFNGHHQRHEGFDGHHIHRLHINKEEGSIIYSSYQGCQGPQYHQSSVNKVFFRNIIIIIQDGFKDFKGFNIIMFKASISLKTYPMVPLYIFITIRVPTPQKRGTKTSPLVCNTLWDSYAWSQGYYMPMTI